MEYLGLEPPGSPWSLRSRGLAEGLTLYEDGVNRWGIPHRIAQDPHNAGFFEVDDSVLDHAESAFEQWREQNKNADPGVLPVVRFDERAKKGAAARRKKRAEAARQAAAEVAELPEVEAKPVS